MKVPNRILPIIVFSQFAVTSLWFAGNAIISDLKSTLNIGIEETGIVTSAIQLGFIIGTLLFAIFSISDRYSPRKIFFICSILGSFSNLLIYLIAYNLFSLLVIRFITGFFLAGIYPIGMKIAAGWYKGSLGNALGFLVGSLVLGTAFPHLIRSLGSSLDWSLVVFTISGFSIIGGTAIYLFVSDGPNITSGTKFNPKAISTIFKNKELRAAAFGYFGHMWELYTFWALIPSILLYYSGKHFTDLNISLWSFLIISVGSLGCVVGGIISKNTGSSWVAYIQLILSCTCCLITPIMLDLPIFFFILFMIFWGIVVVGDSPQYSTIVALTAPKEIIGSGLTLVNSIGFAITILSLWTIYQFLNFVSLQYALILLALGPVIGIFFMRPLVGVKN